MLTWIALTFLAAAALRLGIAWLLRRLGVEPAAPEQRAGGFRDVVARLRDWTASRPGRG
ncbi:hypothetical protein NET02_15115 [Thermomicrobiaceae bacterium CFH 74404]|uniref:Uncharacterized protein n=1 Tax=Thermalbibacter longus TaxID=2951981 RepID=A0AA41WCQ9_9BACT|nr:hypothetical protein [Thermalbibacter longus]MCM8750477.1 hypothetical protein [Thermalbibacter longus]